MNLSSPAAVSELLRRHNFLPIQKFGQNFLVDANILAKIVAAGELQAGDSVIEIGTGLGVLTRALAKQVGVEGKVVTLERDPRLHSLYAETLSPDEFPQVAQVECDALEIDFGQLSIDRLGAQERGPAVVANIPYNITSPIIAALLELTAPLRVIVLLVQREVAERLAANPGTPQYGAFTVFTQFYAEVQIVGSASPTVFFPPPKVTSAIIRLRPRQAAPVDLKDRERFFAIVRASFGQRRKTILNALASDVLGWTKLQSQAVLEEARIDSRRRGETLSMEEFAELERAAGNLQDMYSV